MNSQALEYHLTCNHYPPINGEFAQELAANAIEMCIAGKEEEVVKATAGIPNGAAAAISWPATPEKPVTAGELVMTWHLEGFVEIELAGAVQTVEDFEKIEAPGAGQMYNAQCMSGHVWMVESGDSLYARCKAREERGLLDALAVSGDECPYCQEDREQEEEGAPNG